MSRTLPRTNLRSRICRYVYELCSPESMRRRDVEIGLDLRSFGNLLWSEIRFRE